ncbi:(d)CMP kinase [Sneathia sp. DSM 16631]|uniref:(d)CMP kinase n=1 Tax=Sneathia TaxID=168808 RepID=UPI001868180A|nr:MULTISPECIES: (d)CMP kinase [Sneathia]MBE3030899.1 (d)CMP kinase [Sneathia sp. DSM 16631]MDK9582402.1 (d)CMP kinase [Sneathia vaginalis]
MIIAVDGPSGSGKSSISKEIAKKLNIQYLDTGAMYRLLALYLEENSLEFSKEVLKDFNIKQSGETFYLNGVDVSKKIRTNDISKKASDISKIKEVREYMVDLQRKISKSHSVILDGRDISTVVFPNADFKIFLTASVEVRAKRRFLEDKTLSYDKILEDIQKRDYQDMNRKNSPLRIAKGATVIDTSQMTKEQVIQKIISLVKGGQNAL